MNLSALQLWQRSALQPSEWTLAPRRARHRPDGSAVFLAPELRRARELSRRMHDAVTRGLFLSVLLGAPVGWSFAHSALLAGDPRTAEACPSLGSFLPPALERDLKELGASGGLSTGDRQMLGMKICDPGLRLAVEPLLKGVTDLGELQDLAEAQRGLEAALPKAASAALAW